MQNFAISGQNIRLPFIFVSSGDGQTPIQNITQATSNLIVEYHPPSGASFLTKSVDANNLRNLGRGVYDIIFSGATELTSTGLFQYYGIVSGTTAPFYGQIQIVESGATAIAAQIITNTIKLNQILSSGNALETSVQSVQTAVNQILSSGNALQSTLVTVSGVLTTVSGNVSTAQTSLNQILSSGNAFQSTLVTVSGILTTVSGDVATKASQASVNSILSSGHSLDSGNVAIIVDATWNELLSESRLSGSYGSGVRNLLTTGTASQTSVDSLQTSVNQILSSGIAKETTLVTVSGNLDAKSSQTSVNTLQTSVNSILSSGNALQSTLVTVSGILTTVSGDVATKSSQTSVNSILSSGHAMRSGDIDIVVDAFYEENFAAHTSSPNILGSGLQSLLSTGTASQASVNTLQTSVNSILSSGHAIRSGDIDIIADKVLDEQISQHLATGSLGSGIYRLLSTGVSVSLSASDVGTIVTGVWNETQTLHTTVGTFGYYLDAQVSAAAAAVGANTVNIGVKLSDGTALGGTKITVKNNSQTATLGVKSSNAEGTGSFSLDNGSYKVILQRYDVLYTVPENLTVAGTTNVVFTGSLFNVSSPVSPSGCTVYGWLINGSGLAVTGASVIANYLEPDTLSAFAIVSSPMSVVSNVSGYFEIQLLRTSTVKIIADDGNSDVFSRKIVVPNATSGNWVNL